MAVLIPLPFLLLLTFSPFFRSSIFPFLSFFPLLSFLLYLPSFLLPFFLFTAFYYITTLVPYSLTPRLPCESSIPLPPTQTTLEPSHQEHLYTNLSPVFENMQKKFYDINQAWTYKSVSFIIRGNKNKGGEEGRDMATSS